jgi:nucleoside-diphosphate-sugar epimerase
MPSPLTEVSETKPGVSREEGMNERGSLHVVLGMGPLGLAVARHLAGRGERVRAVSRSGLTDLPGDVEVFAANVAEDTEVKRACDGAAVVYHCANPPYAKWRELHPPLMQAIIEGAAAAEAKLVFGDNLYAYGRVDGPLTEDMPNRSEGPNGRTRARIGEMLMQAHELGRIRATIGRGSDFFGPTRTSRRSVTGSSPGRWRGSRHRSWGTPMPLIP